MKTIHYLPVVVVVAFLNPSACSSDFPAGIDHSASGGGLGADLGTGGVVATGGAATGGIQVLDAGTGGVVIAVGGAATGGAPAVGGAGHDGAGGVAGAVGGAATGGVPAVGGAGDGRAGGSAGAVGIDAGAAETTGATTGCASSASSSPAALLPADRQIGAWVLSAAPVLVEDDISLFGMIDGAAPKYIGQGWVRGVYAAYQQSGSSGSSIQVDIHDMGTPEFAERYFDTYLPVSRIQISANAVIDMGLGVGYSALAWSGQYIAEVISDDDSDAALTDVRMFTLTILSRVCAAGLDAGGAPEVAPEAAPASLGFASVTAAFGATCGLKTDGTIVCWGGNAQAKPPSGAFKSLGMGGWACGVRTDSSMVCWDSASGELFGAVTDPATPDEFAPPPGSYSAVSVGYVRACGLRTDRTVTCWGWDCTDVEAPPPVAFAQVSSGDSFVCGVKSDGALACWNQCYGPGIAAPPSGTFTSVSVGVGFACGVRTGGTLACWGDNTGGGATPPAGNFKSVSAGNQYACGVKSDGTLACWGDDSYGRATPPSGTFSSISAGYEYACGVRTDGTVACWGNNDSGEATPPAP